MKLEKKLIRTIFDPSTCCHPYPFFGGVDYFGMADGEGTSEKKTTDDDGFPDPYLAGAVSLLDEIDSRLSVHIRISKGRTKMYNRKL